MVSSQGTSFRPSRPTKGKVKAGSVRKIYLLSYISYVLFFCTILAAGGMFLYTFSLNTQLAQQKELLDQERQSFNQSDLIRIQELEQRINTAVQRLNNHVSVVSIFSALEQSVPDLVYFLDFKYSRLVGGSPEVAVTAKADGFNALLFQKQVLDANQVLANTTLSDVSMKLENNPDGSEGARKIVTFTMLTSLDPSTIPYTGEQNFQIGDVADADGDIFFEDGLGFDEFAELEETGAVDEFEVIQEEPEALDTTNQSL